MLVWLFWISEGIKQDTSNSPGSALLYMHARIEFVIAESLRAAYKANVLSWFAFWKACSQISTIPSILGVSMIALIFKNCDKDDCKLARVVL